MSRSATPLMPYRGRFGPSPTGPLHFGSLVAAVGSYLDARHHHGEWQLRIEDIDAPRARPGAADGILRTLEAFGLEWDGPVVYQSRRSSRYEEALDRLQGLGYLYGCACTRRELAQGHPGGHAGTVYPGTCRSGVPPGRRARSLRVRVDRADIRIEDRLQGPACQSVSEAVGDFIVRRADGFTAYQLAVVVDDAEQAVTHVVRGADLFESTPQQVYLQRLLGMSTPAYLHLPVAASGAGTKLSKQTRARAILPDPEGAVRVLRDVLCFLNQRLPRPACELGLRELSQWAVAHWDVKAIPRTRRLPAPSRYAG